MDKKLAVLGSGYVGLVAGACFAEIGHEVTCIDINEEIVERLQNGDIPIYEPGLEEMVLDLQKKGSLSFSADWGEELKNKDAIFIAVGTPKREDGSCDISYVMSAAEMIGQTVDSDTVVVDKSTVPVGTGELVDYEINSILEERFGDTGPRVEVVSNPEFLREGCAIGDFMEPDRVVVGSESSAARDTIASLYEPLEAAVVKTGLRTAEMIKYSSNAFLATKISFINEIANVCELVGADVQQVARAVGLDHRINRDFLGAGVGYGGSCFPKDTEALVQIAGQGGYHSQILSAVMAVNQQQRTRFAGKILRHLPDDIENPRLAVLGVAFKPNTDDMREAPAVDIIHELQSEGVKVSAYDPVAMENAKSKIPGVDWGSSAEEIIEGADGLVLLTEWDEFLELDYDRVKEKLNRPLIFDGRNALPMLELIKKGFDYYGVGRGVDRLDGIISSKKLLEGNKSKRS
ncbi:MAG: UDP-glucose dehydrogenase family protein [bacterium]